jgi:rSAM/selenodomain-associated transferase 1
MSDSSIQGSVLIVFLRRPALNVGKQRIAAELGAEAALELARCLLAAALEDASQWPGRVVLAPAQSADVDWTRDLLDGRADSVAQPTGNLGQRINAVDHIVRESSQARVIFIGTDAPGLDCDYLMQAHDALADFDVVLGPAADGGVTLMGARQPWPDLSDLPWETPELGRALEAVCVNQGLSVKQLGRRYDVDTQTDLARAYADLKQDSRPARRRLVQWIAANGRLQIGLEDL